MKMLKNLSNKLDSEIAERKFRKIKKEKPESRIGQKSISYSMARHNLVKVLKTGDVKNEQSARMNYLVEKIVSKEKLSKSEKKFILSLFTEDLDKFLGLLLNNLMDFVHGIHVADRMDAEELYKEDVDGFLAINKMFDFIKENRKDVRIKRYYFGPKFRIGEYRGISQPAGIYYDE